MILCEPSSKQDIIDCVEMYISKDQWIPVSRQESLANLYTVWKSNKFLKVVKDDRKIIAWLYALIMQPPHQAFLSYYQQYCCTNSTPIKNYKAIKLLHEDLIQQAEEEEIPLVYSGGSHLDETLIFPRILEKLGWDRRGYLCTWTTSHYSKASSRMRPR
jgi:hypothetical protein